MQGGFEAGLIGGLADWFAVTALFRHPLNIKIPHTALLPKNRERIIQTILHVLENEWLTKESIVNKINNIQIAQLLLDKIETELQSNEMKKQLQKAAIYLASNFDLNPFMPQFEMCAKKLLSNIKTEYMIQKAIDKALENQMDEKLYTMTLKMVESKLSDQNTKDEITKMITNAIDKNSENKIFGIALKSLMSMASGKVAEIIDVTITEFLEDLKRDTSENRKKIIGFIQNEMEKVKNNESVLQQIDTLKQSTINKYDMEPLFETLKNQIQNILLEYVRQENFIDDKLSPIIKKGIVKLKEHPTALLRLDAWIKEEILDIIEQNHQKIGQLVKDNLDKMTNDEITVLLENKIGNDISWIRVNGALCGSLIGLALTGIKLITG
ncbi:DUF445 domain-containing protein [Psychrobacillus sp. NPDC058041]|uniref:DUF445 domain-containing protein n=1 Tax=Psychrobacillus sp. NPDC058041 TaxID=3346310 RepID=UPI0036DF481C